MAAHLPPELLQQVIQELQALDSAPLASLAMVNRHWLAVVEQFLWRDIKIDLSDHDFFKTLFSRASRRCSLKSLTIFSYEWFESDYQYEDMHRVRSQEDEDDFVDDHDEDEEYASEEDWDWDDGVVAEDYDDLEKRALILRQETQRFWQQMHAFWDELAGWGQDLNVNCITIDIAGNSIYRHLGRGFRAAESVERYLAAGTWLGGLHDMPMVPSVHMLMLYADGRETDLWPAIMSCKLARTLPNLQKLVLHAFDLEKTWHYARKHFRGILAQELAILPPSLLDLQLALAYSPFKNHEAALPSFLEDGLDSFSRALSIIATNLTKLSISVGHISPEIFWKPEVAFPSSRDCRPIMWPNLREIHIVTGLEMATARYWMRSSDHEMPHHNFQEDSYFSHYDDSVDEHLSLRFGDHPIRQSRDRPEPSEFDILAVSIARAVACSPILRSVSLQFETFGGEMELEYEGWGFFFRSGQDVQKTTCWPNDDTEYYPGIDTHPLERPRSEWVFRCPHHQLAWEEPDEAKALWKEKFPDMDFDTVTIEDPYDENDSWYRWRNGKNIGPAILERPCGTTNCTTCYYWDQDLKSFRRRR